MKKFFLPLALVLATLFMGETATAQANWEAGVRFGNQFSVEATIPLAAAPRFHPAVYFSRFGLGGYFDWMFALSGGPRGLKFYPGVGPTFFFGNKFDVDLVGDFGVEYSFGFPLTIGFDWRPGFRATDSFKWRSDNWGFFARLRFGEGVSFQRAD